MTVGGIFIMPPMHFGGVTRLSPTSVMVKLVQLKGLLSEKALWCYVRDLIRMAVEEAQGARYEI